MSRDHSSTFLNPAQTLHQSCRDQIPSFTKTCGSPKTDPGVLTTDFAREWSDRMLTMILYLFRLLRLVGSGHQAVGIENLALRRQLAAYRRKRKRPLLTQLDRWFWIGLSYVWKNWRDALVFVQPDTVLRWQRDRFRGFWTRLSNPNGRRQGRPAITKDIRRLILQMATANPLCGRREFMAN